MDHYAMAELVHAAAKVHSELARDHADDVQALVEVEWARVTLAERIFAAQGTRIAVTLRSGDVIRGTCTRAGDDWCEIRNHELIAIPLTSIECLASLPTVLHDEHRRLPRWTSFLRTCSSVVVVHTQQSQHRGYIVAVAQDHLELSTGVIIAHPMITLVRQLPG